MHNLNYFQTLVDITCLSLTIKYILKILVMFQKKKEKKKVV